MPFLVPLLGITTAGLAGAFVGAQIDDKLDTPAQAASIIDKVDPLKIMIYAAGAMGLYWLARKTGALK